MKKTCENVLTRISIYVIIYLRKRKNEHRRCEIMGGNFNKDKFRGAVVGAGLRLEDLAAKLSINPCTLHRKIKANGNFSRSEIVKIVKVCNLNESAACDIFFSA